MAHFLDWTSLKHLCSQWCPGNHFDICGPLPQAMLKLEVPVDARGPTVAWSLVDVPEARVITEGHMDIFGLDHQQRLS